MKSVKIANPSAGFFCGNENVGKAMKDTEKINDYTEHILLTLIAEIKAHEKLQQAFKYMSLSARQIKTVVKKSKEMFDIKMEDNVKQFACKKCELEQVGASLHNLGAEMDR